VPPYNLDPAGERVSGRMLSALGLESVFLGNEELKRPIGASSYIIVTWEQTSIPVIREPQMTILVDLKQA
jgi:hypothetical protein